MTQFSCVGVESNEAWSLCGLKTGAQGYNRSSALTQRMEQTLSQQFTNFCYRLQKQSMLVFKASLQSSMSFLALSLFKAHNTTSVRAKSHKLKTTEKL